MYNAIFQHDNAPAHRANATRNFWFNNIPLSNPLPALSPDLNPICLIYSQNGLYFLDYHGILSENVYFPQQNVVL